MDLEELRYLAYVVVLGALFFCEFVAEDEENVDCVFVEAQGLHCCTLIVAHFDQAAVDVVQL